MPKSATPTVATVLQELPVATETIALTMHAATKKNVGFNIFSP
jgi:hypothetical protein